MTRFAWSAAALMCISVAAQAQSCDTTKVLSQMDAASKRFESTQADFRWDVFQSVVQEHEIQTGTIYFLRHGSTIQMAAYIRQPAEKSVYYDGSTLTLLQPELKQATLFQAGSNRGQYESFLTLGFGGSGKGLEADWTVTCQGMEGIDGVQTAKLDLKPKQQAVANTFSHVTVWIDPARSLSLRQVFYEPSGDYRTVTYSNIQYNAPIAPGMFKPKLSGYSIVRK